MYSFAAPRMYVNAPQSKREKCISFFFGSPREPSIPYNFLHFVNWLLSARIRNYAIHGTSSISTLHFDLTTSPRVDMAKNLISKIVNEDVLVKIFGYLFSNEVFAFAMTCKRCLSISANDAIWKPLCYDDFSIASLADVPPLYEGALSGFQALYMAWCRSFGDEYRRAEVHMAKQWWMRMERWLQLCAPQISATLNPPVSLHALIEAEEELGRPLPRMLKLLYRFHDGQHLLIDEVQFSQLASATYPEAEIIESIFLGLFGGFNFYDDLVNVRFLPLKHCIMITKLLLSNPRYTLASMDLSAYPHWPAKANDDWTKNDSVVRTKNNNPTLLHTLLILKTCLIPFRTSP